MIRTPSFHELLENSLIEEDMLRFIDDVLPENIRDQSNTNTSSGRLLIDIEHTTPYKILCNNSFFDEFRVAHD